MNKIDSWTTIRISTELKDKLLKKSAHPRETYQSIIERLLSDGN